MVDKTSLNEMLTEIWEESLRCSNAVTGGLQMLDDHSKALTESMVKYRKHGCAILWVNDGAQFGNYKAGFLLGIYAEPISAYIAWQGMKSLGDLGAMLPIELDTSHRQGKGQLAVLAFEQISDRKLVQVIGEKPATMQ